MSRPVVAITGGGSGLGEAMALRFAEAGYNLALCGRRVEKLEDVANRAKVHGADSFCMSVDVREADKLGAWLQGAREKFGQLDALVNNAAGNFVCPSLDLSARAWKAVTEINMDGTFYASQAFARIQVKDQRPGSILSIIAAYAWSGQPGTIHSAASKAGILAMMRTLAAEWGRHRIRCNTIAPGPVHTEGTDKNLWSVPGVEQRVVSSIPMGRLGQPKDIADAALFLASEQAQWISGAELTVDGAQWLHGGVFGWDPSELAAEAMAHMKGMKKD
jgi:NAD(P)-dependent dehydrogenase (short-subunit alcohol dehydrogenase family)